MECARCEEPIEYEYYRCRRLESPRGTKQRDAPQHIYCADCHFRDDHHGFYSGFTTCWSCVKDYSERYRECSKCGADECPLYAYVGAYPELQQISGSDWFCLDCLGGMAAAALTKRLARRNSV